ncbi:hypothetical protein COBT_000422 [Conglomerata obtusa]
MNNYESFEEELIRMSKEELKSFCFSYYLFKRTMVCLGSCKTEMKLEICNSYADDAAWRCYVKACTHYKNRRSIRDDSFFESFGTDVVKILKILIRYAGQQTRYSILQTIDISKPTLCKIIKN